MAVPGPVRLLLELIFFGAAVALLSAAGRPSLAFVFAALLLVHYAVAYKRLARLLRTR